MGGPMNHACEESRSSRIRRFFIALRHLVGQAFGSPTALNTWLAERFTTTHKTIFALEISAVVGVGFAMMEIGEHFIAGICWLVLAFLWVLKIFQGEMEKGHRGLAIFERAIHLVVALVVSSFLIIVTAIHRGTDPWSNLMMLGVKTPAHRHTLSHEERALFEKPLQGVQKPPMHIQVACPASDEQTCVYATQFQAFFSEAGWDVDGTVQRVTLVRAMQGVVLVEHGGTEESQTTKWKWNVGGYTAMSPTFENVYQAFSNIGVEPESSANFSIPENQITVYFGPERENESQPTDLTSSVVNIRRLRKSGLLPAPGQLPTPEMIEKSREQSK